MKYIRICTPFRGTKNLLVQHSTFIFCSFLTNNGLRGVLSNKYTFTISSICYYSRIWFNLQALENRCFSWHFSFMVRRTGVIISDSHQRSNTKIFSFHLRNPQPEPLRTLELYCSRFTTGYSLTSRNRNITPFSHFVKTLF